YARIINTTSPSGIYGNAGQTNYGAAKAGIAGFTRVLALELAKYGCTVNTISPGAMTRMTIPLREARGEKVTDADLESGGPQHIAPLVAWLASEAASGVSNQILHAARGSIAIMQQPAIIKAFQKSKGTWTLAELDRYVPQLIEARKTHDAAVKLAGKSIKID
ncbi:MAG TPA: SDR family oxidoreductase, partial [Pseudomonadales bacterium]